MPMTSSSPLSFSTTASVLLSWTLCCHVGVALAEGSSNSTADSDTTIAADSGSDNVYDNTTADLLYPLGVCVGLFLLGLVLATIGLESRRAYVARRQYRDYRDRVEESLERHHDFSKRDPSVVLPLGGGPHTFQFRGRYVDCSFYQSRVSPETKKACCYRSRLRRNVGDQEVPMEGVFTIIDNGLGDKMETIDEESGAHLGNSSGSSVGSEEDDDDDELLSIEGYGSSTYGPFEITSGRLCPYSGRWYLLIEDRPSILNSCVRRKLMMSGFLYTPSDDNEDNVEGKCPGSLHFSGNWRATNGASGQAALLSAWPEGKQAPPDSDRTENMTETKSWSSIYDGSGRLYDNSGRHHSSNAYSL